MKTLRVKQIISVMMLSVALVMLQAHKVSEQATIQIEIQVSPNVLNLNNQGEVVTIHTDIAYGAVAASTVTLNGIAIDHWKADNQGNFVAKFLMNEIKGLPFNLGGYNLMEMTGETRDGDAFYGSSMIKVVNIIPKK
jgi:hypothetical protein